MKSALIERIKVFFTSPDKPHIESCDKEVKRMGATAMKTEKLNDVGYAIDNGALVLIDMNAALTARIKEIDEINSNVIDLSTITADDVKKFSESEKK